MDYLAEVWLNGQPVGRHEGGETPFTLDVTTAIQTESENLLAVRVLNPISERIDGIQAEYIPHSITKGAFNPGGIVQPVQLTVAPAIRVVDLFPRLDWQSGEIQLTVTIRDDTNASQKGRFITAVGPDKTGEILTEATETATFKPGETTHEIHLAVQQHRLWTLSDPFLYRLCTRLIVEPTGRTHEHAVRCGFRDFRVKDGYFFLNGRRIILRSAHTGASFPISRTAPDDGAMRRDLIYAKTSGFNCVRFLSHLALPGQLDLCDELGLMVYEEPYASWWNMPPVPQKELPDELHQVKRRFEQSFLDAILRDRNHPCVVIWGLLNERKKDFIFETAVKTLEPVRALDPTRLILLGSRRWDADNTIGSLSNPGSNVWEPVWGLEGENKANEQQFEDHNGPAYRGQGDFHPYPRLPVKKEDVTFLRTVGRTTKPIFISEGGFGSMANVTAMLRRYEQAGANPELEDFAALRPLPDALETDLRLFGMTNVYPFPEDLMRDSHRLNLRQRRFWFDMLRSNSAVCGVSLTQIPIFTGGCGFWDYWREDINPGIIDVLRDGWAPLRWCLFVNPIHGYAGRPFHLEAVLANEDVLKPGEYPVTFRLWHESEIVWEQAFNVTLPPRGKCALPPLAVPVLNTTIDSGLPPGEYTFAASLDSGGRALGDRMTFQRSDPKPMVQQDRAVALWGVDERIQTWLADQGVQTLPFDPDGGESNEVIVVDKPREADKQEWDVLARRVRSGSVAVFLDPEAMDGVWTACQFQKCNDWLFHKEYVAKPHPIMAGLQGAGMLDPDYYGPVFAPRLFAKDAVPEDTIVAAFTCGYSPPPTYRSGVILGVYAMEKGRFIVNAFNIAQNIDLHPAADRLLLNLLRHAYELATKAQPE